mgnify:CR=1 FL=1
MRRLVAVLALVVLAACSSEEAELDVGDGPLVYAVMGNSLMFTPTGSSVIDQYEAMLAEDFSVEIDVRDHTRGGQSAEEFVSWLEENPVVRSDLAEADVVTFVVPFDEWAEPWMTVSGEGGRDPADCGGDDGLQCLRDTAVIYNDLVDRSFAELMTIVDLTKQVVMVTDFYQLHTDRQTETTRLLYPYFEQMQMYTQEIAGEYGIPVARVWDDFMGPDGEIPNLTEMGLVQTDGLHPTEEGARRIADLFHNLGYELST